MQKILKLTSRLYVDLATGHCWRERTLISGRYVQKITPRQLIVLNHLVLNQGILCSKDSLEALFDSADGEKDSKPCIKVEISKMGRIFKFVDDNFSHEKRCEVFRAVNKLGYIFNIPDEGELITIETPIDTMIQLDAKFIKRMRYTSLADREECQLENIRNAFYGITSDVHIILQAAINGVVVSNIEYRKLLNKISAFIFEDKISNGIVCLMGDGGTGKSTLLCSLAVQAAEEHPNWRIYYLDMSDMVCDEAFFRKLVDYMRHRGISRTNKNLLCIDNPHKNPDGFRKLFQTILRETDVYLFIVVAERLSYLLNIFESDMIYQRNSYIRGIYIDNAEKEDGEKALRSSVAQFQVLKIYAFPQSLKKDIINRMVRQFVKRKHLDRDITVKSLDGLMYDKRTIADIFLDFKGRYNALASKKEGAMRESYIPRIIMDWDEWKIKCIELDKGCTRLKLSEAFPYIAVCHILGIMATFDFVQKMTGYPYRLELLKTFPKGMGEALQFDNNYIRLRHDTVAENYFTCNPGVKPLFYLRELIIKDYMDEITAVLFERKVFSVYVCQALCGKKYAKDLQRMLALFKANADYINSVWNNYRAYSLEFAYIALKYKKDLECRKKPELQREVSESFKRSISTTSNNKVKIVYWSKFFEMSLKCCDRIPESLVVFCEDISSELTSFLSASMHRILEDHMFEWDDKIRTRYCDFVEEICKTMIQSCPENIYIYKTLAGVRIIEKRYGEAKTYIEKGKLIKTEADNEEIDLTLFLIDFTLEEGKNQDVYTVIRTFYSAAEKENLYIRLLSKVTCYQEDLEQECNLMHRDFYTWEVIGILVNDMSLFDSHTIGSLSEISSRFNIP